MRAGGAPTEPLDMPFDLIVTPVALALGAPSGAVIGLDPDTGRRLWRTPVGSGMLAAAAAAIASGPLSMTTWRRTTR